MRGDPLKKRIIEIIGSQWHPYSPENFITPPVPGYPSGHSTVSSAAATILKNFTGSDVFGFVAKRVPGALTGEPIVDTCVYLELPTFTATAAHGRRRARLGRLSHSIGQRCRAGAGPQCCQHQLASL